MATEPTENDEKDPEGQDPSTDTEEGGMEPDTGTQDPEGAEGGDGKAGATVNRHKYERDLAVKDKEIEALKAQIAEASKTKEGREALEKKVDDLKAQMASEKVGYQLELAGCVNVKAAKALLDDYDGDTAKLKEACPYLFGKEKQTGSTGVKPTGPAKDDDAALDRAFGLKK